MPDHPSYRSFFDDSLDLQYGLYVSALLPPGVRFRRLLQHLHFSLPATFRVGESRTPPWLQAQVRVHLDLSSLPKEVTPGSVYHSRFLELRSKFIDMTLIYTDGSKTNDGVGCSFIVGAQSFQYRLHGHCSVFTAELFALYQAVLYICRHRHSAYVICSDSLSAIQSLSDPYPVHPFVHRIQRSLQQLVDVGTPVSFMWVPGHVGIPGNEAADAAAKAAVLQPRRASCCVPSSDLSRVICRRVVSLWHADWAALTDNKLRALKPLPVAWTSSSRPSRREEVVLARLRIGHCRFSHRHLLTAAPAPFCPCGHLLTVRHILMSCPDLNTLRLDLNLPNTLDAILADDPRAAARVLCFINLTNLAKDI
ncbi:uncharacterized protein LOC126462772 [Schistocerca serialis cubense]|uniref:uncharacterized protein LOC126462772 n=1 Tax=Schistocerca serialis cubense TaxID=2023355 RepID=UPI00214EE293|nr:uncharacterized protein LOC126462772 [Schistocerca serialis cubense]